MVPYLTSWVDHHFCLFGFEECLLSSLLGGSVLLGRLFCDDGKQLPSLGFGG